MKKPTEKQSIDELFSRKLGNMSLPPSPDSFERLQARMGYSKPQTRVIIWRNPTIQRYMAAAACLLLVCLFGWLYRPSIATKDQVQVATNQKVPSRQRQVIPKQQNQQQNPFDIDTSMPATLNQTSGEEQVAVVKKLSGINKSGKNLASRPNEINTKREPVSTAASEPVLAQVKPVDAKTTTAAVSQATLPVANQTPTEQLAENKPIPKTTPVAERVLVVTIEEPQALVAARQAAKAAVEEKAVVALNEGSDKETKGGGLWKQVKRIKQGDVFARQDNVSNDEQGLLGRAYSGLKHSFDKDKTAKQ